MDYKGFQIGYSTITQSERKCNNCGFVTFCLRILYQHKLKCKGDLFGFLQRCGYCKRKYYFPFLLKHHKKTCLKRHKQKKAYFATLKRKKISHNKIFKKTQKKQEPSKKIQRKGVSSTKIPIKADKSSKESSKASASTIVCPFCMKFFFSRDLYKEHEENGQCGSKQIRKKSFSARKSVSKIKHKPRKTSDSDNSLISDDLLSEIIDRERQVYKSFTRGYMCIHCEIIFPAKIMLLKHLDLKYRCALAHFERNSFMKPSFKARKTCQAVVARKSFSKVSFKSPSYRTNRISDNFKGSARKSFSNSFNKQLKKSRSFESNPIKSLNQCPVCHEEFSDTFNFYQHQKKSGHWGKATKSMALSCKCPFCQKEFFNVTARNVHIRNHSDRSEHMIQSFLESTTCGICSRAFASETSKLQHIKVEHSKLSEKNVNNTLKNESVKLFSLPLALKQKLKQFPLTCPVCAKEFVSMSLRNKHFEESHLDSDLKCRYCPMKSNCSETLNEHVRNNHLNQFKYECSVCKSKFPISSHLMLHMKKFHPEQNSKTQMSVKADSLNKQNSNVNDIKKTSNHGTNNKPDYFCDICDLGFQKLQFLRRHEQSIQHRDTLIKNLDAVHESLSNLPPSPPQKASKSIQIPKIISCSECYEEFSALKDFVPHRLKHFSEQGKDLEVHEENKYKCEICSDTYDTHSKVQVHLFWHLQVESLSKDEKSSKISKPNFTSSRKSIGQHVAKKSFGKQITELPQEVVIGGVKKHLFTCETCHVGFINQTHYKMHVSKLCKGKILSLESITKDTNKTLSEQSKSGTVQITEPSLNKIKLEAEKDDIVISQCNVCLCLFDKNAKAIHAEICSKCKHNELYVNADVNSLKTLLKTQKAAAACLICNCTFDTAQSFSQHMLSNHVNDIKLESSENKTIESNTTKNLAKENGTCESKVIEYSTTNNVAKKNITLENEAIEDNTTKDVAKENSTSENETIEDNTTKIVAKENSTSENETIESNTAKIVINENSLSENEVIEDNTTKIVTNENSTCEIEIIEDNTTNVAKENSLSVQEESELVNINSADMSTDVVTEVPVAEDETVPVAEDETVIHCVTCSFIFFSTDVLGDHERICQNFSYTNSKLENYTAEFKAILEQNGIIASCLTCDLAFNNSEDVSQHIAAHQSGQEMSTVLVDEPSESVEEKMDTNEVISPNQPDQMTSESNSNVEYQVVSLNGEQSLDASNDSSHIQVLSTSDDKIVSEDTSSDSLQKGIIENLRKNFSQLLSILVSDPDLMQQLGYGELTVDEVLINVLQTMEQTPILKDESISDLECLRKNIQILLDFCLEDQVMALIRDGQTSTDDIVVEALKIFGGESSMSLVSLE